MLVAGTERRGKYNHKVTTRSEDRVSLLLCFFKRDGIVNILDRFVGDFFDLSFEGRWGKVPVEYVRRAKGFEVITVPDRGGRYDW